MTSLHASLKHQSVYADDSAINAADSPLKQDEAILQTDVDNIVKWFYKKQINAEPK